MLKCIAHCTILPHILPIPPVTAHHSNLHMMVIPVMCTYHYDLLPEYHHLLLDNMCRYPEYSYYGPPCAHIHYLRDCVPGRANTAGLMHSLPGVLYGQCSEICGSLHGYMPLSVSWYYRPTHSTSLPTCSVLAVLCRSTWCLHTPTTTTHPGYHHLLLDNSVRVFRGSDTANRTTYPPNLPILFPPNEWYPITWYTWWSRGWC